MIRPDDTLSTVLFSEGQTFGGDTSMLTWTIDADNLEIIFTAKDTTTYQSGPIAVLVQTIYTEPPIDTIIYQVTINEQAVAEPEPEPEIAAFEPLELQPIPFPRDINELNVDLAEQARADFYQDNAWWIKLALILLIGAIVWAIFKWREQQQRQLIAEIESRDQAPYIWNIELNEGTNIVMNASFRSALTRLRQRSKEDIFKLDIPRTVQATIKKAGLVDFQYKQETRPPEYLLLIERDNPKDHRALVFDALFQSFRQNEVLVERYYFNGDVRTCYNETYPWGINIKDLQHQYSAARLLIIGNGYRLLNPVSGKLARWTNIFKNWRDRAILSPLPLEKWGRKERQLTNLFHYLPATIEGLRASLEQFEALEPKPNEQVLAKIKDAAKQPIALKVDLIESLQTHFPEKMVQWIAACAIYPSLHWDLTLFLGQELSEEGSSLLRLEYLLSLTRLPWFIEGKIPDAARADLIEYLAKANLEEPIRRKIDAVLRKAPKPESDSVAYDDYRMNVILNELLFTKDRQKKKALEEEFAQYLAAGNEPDFMVFKYLDREPTRFDFIVPHTWKKYVAPGQIPFINRRLGYIIAILGGIFVGGYKPTFDLCNGQQIEYQDRQLCLENDRDRIIFYEVQMENDILEGRLRSTSVSRQFQDLFEQYPAEADTFYQNIATVWYNKGIELYNTFETEVRAKEPNRTIPLPDSICQYFSNAVQYDTLSRIDLSIEKAIPLNVLCFSGLDEEQQQQQQQQYPASTQNIPETTSNAPSRLPTTPAPTTVGQKMEIFEEFGRVGLRNKKGTIEVKPIYNNIEFDSGSGLYRVQINKGKELLMGYIDERGAEVIPIEYLNLGFVQEGLILAEKALFGYLNTRGEVVIDLQFEQATAFSNGEARVTKLVNGTRETYSIEQTGICIKDCPEWETKQQNVVTSPTEVVILDESGNVQITVGESIKDRKIKSRPPIMDFYSGSGKVAVQVCVNAYGEVESAQFTQKGSTTSDQQLKDLAEKNAQEWQFEAGKVEQECGTLTYTFKKLDTQTKKLPALYFIEDGRDGQMYRIIDLKDGRTWMMENLIFTIDDSWCYDDDPKKCQQYGRLYTRDAAKKACAGLGDGWRLPTGAEWTNLMEVYGGEKAAYKSLIKGGDAGFAALLGGRRGSDGSYYGDGVNGYYWSSTESAATGEWVYYFSSGKLRPYYFNKSIIGFSCRCIQD